MKDGLDFLGDFFRTDGDDFAPQRALLLAVQVVPNGGREVAVKNAQKHRLDLIVVDKVRGDGHCDIQKENNVDVNQEEVLNDFF